MNKKTNIGIAVIIGLIILSFIVGRCTKDCSSKTINVPVTVPEKKGEFDTKDTTQLVPIQTREISKIVYNDSIIYVPTVNQHLVDKYLQTKDELDKLKLYTDAIKINSYETVFDNNDLKLIVKAKTEGKLLELKPIYTIKEQTLNVEVPKPKEKIFSLNVGAGLTTTKQLDKLDPSVHLDLINKKGNILSASYSVDGVIGVKYSIPLFSIKK